MENADFPVHVKLLPISYLNYFMYFRTHCALHISMYIICFDSCFALEFITVGYISDSQSFALIFVMSFIRVRLRTATCRKRMFFGSVAHAWSCVGRDSHDILCMEKLQDKYIIIFGMATLIQTNVYCSDRIFVYVISKTNKAIFESV